MEVPETCYRCSKLATSKEHVPAKCLFPELKDNPEKDFKINLIKVPSCDLHNTLKSKDDEFLLMCLSGSVQTNKHGYNHFKTKVNRALKRSNYLFLNKIVQDYKRMNIVHPNGVNMKILKGKADLTRLNNCFQSIVFGLYFHQFKTRFEGEIKMMNDFILPENKNQENYVKLVKELFINEKKETKVLGHNPEIFNYQFACKNRFGIISLKMSFYEGLNVFVSLIPKGSKIPKSSTMDMINAGLKTIIELPSGNIEFNE